VSDERTEWLLAALLRRAGLRVVDCWRCAGKGEVGPEREDERGDGSWHSSRDECPACCGRGEVLEDAS
jgi:DnaJ-class molecular chaperone